MNNIVVKILVVTAVLCYAAVKAIPKVITKVIALRKESKKRKEVIAGLERAAQFVEEVYIQK